MASSADTRYYVNGLNNPVIRAGVMGEGFSENIIIATEERVGAVVQVTVRLVTTHNSSLLLYQIQNSNLIRGSLLGIFVRHSAIAK